ncbi:acyl-CoA N-acyltransferase [Polychaeton citri CBS 116435]|uniref:Acyl-CoA N-acyltransferase n=1 Tax=Polychaeton citri CBS 116435 TaxID=1314669 RepID=A0A9P4Q3V3_9PEZI|nr:acyl-CoA N-acyltransferase [Polychaeton citri CBS 116435]
MAVAAVLSPDPGAQAPLEKTETTLLRESVPFGLRRAIISDVEAITKLGTQVFTATFGHSVSAEELAAYLESAYTHTAIKADIQDPNKDLIVATTTANTQDGLPEEKVLGFAQLTRNSREPCVEHLPKTVELQRLYVDIAAHGMGVGKAMSIKLDDMAREQGFQYIWLGVWEENVKAHKVYARLGYETVGDHDFAVGPVVQRDLIMVKKL